MFASPTAMWLNSFFAGYDHFFLKLMHGLEHPLGFCQFLLGFYTTALFTTHQFQVGDA